MFAAAAAALLAGCSDATRFAADPFSDPFRASASGAPRRLARGVDRAPTGAISAAPRIASAPKAVASAAAATPVAAKATAVAAPIAASGALAHWTPQGGTPITVGEGESAGMLANRYGVPADALLKANGYSSAAQVQPGAKLVIPVYRASATAAAPAPQKAAKSEDAEKPAAPPAAKKAEAKPAAPKAAKAAVADDNDDDAPAAKPHKKDSQPKPVTKQKRAEADETPDVIVAGPAPRNASELARLKGKVAAAGDDGDDDAPATKHATKASPVKAAPKAPVKAHVAAKSDDDEDARPVTKPQAKPVAAKAKVARADDEDEAAPKARAVAKPAPAKVKVAKADDDEDETVPAHKAKPASSKVKVAKADEDEDETPRKAAPAKPVKAKTVVARKDDDEDERPAAPVRSRAPTHVARAEAASPRYLATPPAASPAAPAPAPQQVARAETPAVAAPAEKPASASISTPRGVDHVATGGIAAPAPSAAAPVKEEKPVEATMVSTNPDRPEFRWPARGRVIQGFAPGGNDGINIAVPEGTSVKAAEGGVVAYAGNELKGYGNLVLIRHPNGYVTAYAHNGEITVKRGDHVARGQIIAKSGQSGNVGSPQLHFELRRGATPVDPTNYMAAL